MSNTEKAAQLAQLKQQLADIHWPEPVSLWPPAIGWVLLLIVLLLTLSIALLLAYRHHRANAYRRQALDELSTLDTQNQEQAAAALSQLLRRCQLHIDPNADHSAQGAARYRQMARFCRGDCPLSSTDIEHMETLSFGAQSMAPERFSELIGHSREWIKKHRRKPQQTGGQNA